MDTKIYWIDKIKETVLIKKLLPSATKPCHLLQINCKIKGEEVILTGRKKELLELRDIITKHFQNKKVFDF